jgi:hypothetical protein
MPGLVGDGMTNPKKTAGGRVTVSVTLFGVLTVSIQSSASRSNGMTSRRPLRPVIPSLA